MLVFSIIEYITVDDAGPQSGQNSITVYINQKVFMLFYFNKFHEFHEFDLFSRKGYPSENLKSLIRERLSPESFALFFNSNCYRYFTCIENSFVF